MAEEQDKTHRLLLQFPRLVKDLIRLCLGGEWVRSLDFNTLERVPERLLSPELIRREKDALWRVAYYPASSYTDGKNETAEQLPTQAKNYLQEDVEIVERDDRYFYIYLHIEHQTRPRRFMALDMVGYKVLTLQSLVRNGVALDDLLPNLLSLVFYNGEDSWTEARSLLELIHPTEGLPEDLNFWSYRLIDAQRLDLENLIGSQSPLLGLFQLEQLESIDELSIATQTLRDALGADEQELKEAFVTFINEAVLPKLTPPSEKSPRIQDIDEVPTMVAQRIERITQGWVKQGREEGRLEGRQEGRLALLQRQLELKFGQLPPAAMQRLQQADAGRLDSWGERVLTAQTLDEVFA